MILFLSEKVYQRVIFVCKILTLFEIKNNIEISDYRLYLITTLKILKILWNSGVNKYVFFYSICLFRCFFVPDYQKGDANGVLNKQILCVEIVSTEFEFPVLEMLKFLS